MLVDHLATCFVDNFHHEDSYFHINNRLSEETCFLPANLGNMGNMAKGMSQNGAMMAKSVGLGKLMGGINKHPPVPAG